jgi:hypothetical protein
MQLSATRLFIFIGLLCVLLAGPAAAAPWDQAVLETITTGQDFDTLGRRAMAIDDMGTIHAIYQRGVGAEQILSYVFKSQDGIWSTPEVVGAPGSYPGPGWLEVRKETGEPYIAFFQSNVLTLGIRRASGWEFHSLNAPAEFGVEKVAMTLDSAGFAHVALLVLRREPNTWKMAYGYWDGSLDFHFQLFQESHVPHHGLFGQPDIVVKRNGGVAIAYQNDILGQFLITVSENDYLGGEIWWSEEVDVPGVIVFPESLEIDGHGRLHLAFHVNTELGAAHHVYYASRKAKMFGTPVMISGMFTGARPRIAFTPNGKPHFLFEETSGPRSTGRMIHVSHSRGKWRQEVVLENGAFAPSFLMDTEGNGNLLFERKIVHNEDNDIEHFGYVVPQ